MLRKLSGLSIALFLPFFTFSQSLIPVNDIQISAGEYLGISQISSTEVQQDILPIPDGYHEVINFRDRYRTGPVERNLYPSIDPLWNPNQGKITQRTPNSTLLHNFNGIGFTNVNPPDPSVAAGPNHVIQMVNGSGGAVYKIFDKTGTALTGNINFDNLFSGYSGLGDPIVMYDQLANRWFLSEFSSSGNKLLVAISLTDDPTGNFHTYAFQAVNFPDYPKYSIWPNAYFCTANESSSSIYAFERDSMLVGANANLIRYSVQDLNGFGFQTLTPVNFTGTSLPSTPTAATFWRHVDDEAHYPALSNPFNDYVEYWEFTPNFTNVNNSTFTGPNTITVSDFDSDLNGYFAFSAIVQKGSTVMLDPLREVFMNRMTYRNFGNYESLVACHVTDVDGTDRAGMRWYEFRKTGASNWSLYQEGTYSPTNESRWMGAISINAEGSICLAYSVAGIETYPSLRYTGRNISDSAGVMTIPEQIIVTGAGANFANRYGDYADMVIDPADDSTFWFNGEYNPTSAWNTQIAHIKISDACSGLTGTTVSSGTFNCPSDLNGQVTITAIGGTGSNYTYSLNNGAFQGSNTFTALTPGNHIITINDGTCTAEVPFQISGPEPFTVQDSLTQIPCPGGNNGAITVAAIGGTGYLAYSIDSSNWSSSGYYTNLSGGNYTVWIRDSNNCLATPLNYTVMDPNPLLINVTITHPTTSTTTDAEILVHATGGTAPFQFSLNNINFQIDSLFSNLVSGTYTVYIKDDNNCRESQRFNANIVSINELSTDAGFTIFPNPTQGVFQVELLKNNTSSNTQLVIRDVTGKEIVQKSIAPTATKTIINFDLSTEAKGVYFLSVSTNGDTETVKILVE